MAKRQFLQLAHNYDPDKVMLSMMYVSEKLDGMRFFWDAGASRGIPTVDVPYANTTKDKKQVIATGLWSRYGKAIAAPDWWLDQLPLCLLDGELFLGRGRFQELVGIAKSSVNPKSWEFVQAKVFDSPLISVFADGKIDLPNQNTTFLACKGWWISRVEFNYPADKSFESRLGFLRSKETNDVFQLVEQERLPPQTALAETRLEEKMKEVLDGGGEGLILKSPQDIWKPERVRSMLKYKPYFDAEAEVVGYTEGKGKLLGMMGALVVKSHAGEFKLSGFTDQERKDAKTRFPIGTIVTYRFRETTDEGLPREGRYYRSFPS